MNNDCRRLPNPSLCHQTALSNESLLTTTMWKLTVDVGSPITEFHFNNGREKMRFFLFSKDLELSDNETSTSFVCDIFLDLLQSLPDI